MGSILLLLRESEKEMSPACKNAAKYILANPQKTTRLTIRELAKLSFSSPSCIVRLCQSLGYSGYKSFSKDLLSELSSINNAPSFEKTEISTDDSLDVIVQKVTANNIRSLENTRHLVQTKVMEKAIQALIDADSILLFGMGSSLCSARDTALKFLRMNRTCMIHDDWHSQLLMARNSSPKDAALVFSYSGQTKEMIECVTELKKHDTPVIAITRYAKSPISTLSTLALFTSPSEPLIRNGAMSSRIAQLNIVDILFTAMIYKEFDSSMEQVIKTHISKPD